MLKRISHKKIELKNKKGGANILYEFVCLLPFFVIVVLLLIDILKFYYVYNITSIAAYNASYTFSQTANVDTSTKSSVEIFKTGFVGEREFRSSQVKGWLYQYKKNPDGTINYLYYELNDDKTGLRYGNIGGLTDGANYDNQRMIDREVWGFRYEVKNRLLTTIPVQMIAGNRIPDTIFPIRARNNVFEMQRFDNK
jgi:hypothetical protein